jgi:hypothetical protein
MRYSKFLLFFLLLSFSKCASLQNYLSNRALDFTDILTLGGEVNTYGGSAWLWCFGGGAQIGQYGEGYGMRNGYVGYYRTGGDKKFGKLKMGNSFFLMNSQEHIPQAYKTKRSMKKKYTHANFLFFLPANLRGGGYYRYSNAPNSNYNNNHSNYYPYSNSANLPSLCHAPVNVEFSLGLGLGGRVGINFSEIFDFVLGFTTFDLMEDDEQVKLEGDE